MSVLETKSVETGELRSGALGTSGLALSVLGMVGPMAAFVSAGALAFSLTGPGASGVFLISAVLFLLFASGYLAMSRKMGSASGFIAFINAAFGRRAGVAASYVTLLTYATLMIGLYGAYSMFLNDLFVNVFGLDLGWQFWIIAAILINAILSYNRVEFSMRLMSVLLILALLAILILDFRVLFSGGSDEGFSFVGFTPNAIFGPGFGIAALFALGAFAGVESTAVFSEEVKDRRKTISRAMYAAIATLGVFYVFSTWAIANAVGVSRVQEMAGEDPTGFIFTIAGELMGQTFAQILNILVVTSFFAVLLGFTNVFSRYIFALGRARILPAKLGTSHPKHQSPHIASVVVAATMLVLEGVFILVGADPFAHIYAWMVSIATVGIMLLMSTSSVSVIAYFAKHKDAETTKWSTVIAPALAAAGLLTAVIFAVFNFWVLTESRGLAEWLWVVIPIVGIIGYVVGGQDRYKNVSFEGANA